MVSDINKGFFAMLRMTDNFSLVNLFIIAVLAVHLLFSLWRKSSLYFFFTFITATLKYFSRVSLVESLFMSLLWVSPRDRESVLAIKLEFLFYDTKGFTCYFALNSPVEDIIGDIRNACRKLRSGDYFLYFWKGCLVV